MRKENEVMSNKEKLTERWTQGRISEAMLRVYVRKGIISKADFEEICGKKYSNFKISKWRITYGL